MRVFRLSALALVLAAVSALFVPPTAFALAPTSTLIMPTVAAVHFESSSDNITQTYKDASLIPTPTAWWGEVAGTGVAGTGGLWCAGIGGALPYYPTDTIGEADWQVRDTSDYYQSFVSYSYIMPTAADYADLSVLWYGANPQPSPISRYDFEWPDHTASWVTRTYERTSDTSKKMPGYVPSSAGWLQFRFTDLARNSSLPGRGATIDDLSLTGYKYGPVLNLAAVRGGTPTDVTITWDKPVTKPGGSTTDSRTLSYRIWRHDMVTDAWTELTSDASRVGDSSPHQYVDHAVSVTRSYQYIVQAWDPASSVVYGVAAPSVFVAADNTYSSLTGNFTVTSSTSLSVPYATPLSIYGALTDGASAPIPSMTSVVLQSSSDQSAWTTEGAITVTASATTPGAYSASFPATKSSYYRLRFQGLSGTFAPSVSPTLQVTANPVATTLALVSPATQSVPWDGEGNLRVALQSDTESAIVGQATNVAVQTSSDGSTNWLTASLIGSVSEPANGVYLATTTSLKSQAFFRLVYPGDVNHQASTSQVFEIDPGLPTSVFVGGHASPSVPAYNGATTIAATLQGPAGGQQDAALVGKTVVLQSSRDARAWTTLSAGVSSINSSGLYAGVVNATAKMYYRLNFVGDGVYPAASSAPYLVLPRAYLTTPKSKPTVTHNKAFTVSGYLKSHHGRGAKSVLIKAYRYQKGRWVLRQSFWATNYDYSDYTKYSVRIKLRYSGKWQVYAYHSDSDHAATTSGHENVKVK